MSHGLTACEVSLEVFASKRCVRSSAAVLSAPSRSAGFGGTYLKFTDSGAALFACQKERPERVLQPHHLKPNRLFQFDV
jgi:hypothetical protein